MLTPEQIAAISDKAAQIADPINKFLVEDICRRISGAGQLTSSAAYQIYRAQQLGLSQREVKKQLRKLLGVSHKEIRRLLTQSAEVGYNFDISQLPYVQALPFERNPLMQQLTLAAVKLASKDFTNLTQTLGMVDPFGKAQPLQEAYRKSMDFAFKQVFTGATDYNTAIRQATKNIADMGVRTIDYASGMHTGLEAAVRRNIMGGLGLMQEQISQSNYDMLGCDGWEISAHAASAPDHEPIQGKQYGNAEYQELNSRLARRIGTLNCGHAAFPIIMGVNSPQWSDEKLQRFIDDNATGLDYQGRHYTLYEASQKQRQVERAIRKQKRIIIAAEATDDSDKLLTSQIRCRRLNDEYVRFSKATGQPTQRERLQVAGFGVKQAGEAITADKKYYSQWKNEIGGDIVPKDIDKYRNLRYTDSPEHEMVKRYARGVQSGLISPNALYSNYKQLHSRIQSEIVGKATANGIVIKGQSEHFMHRVLGTGADPNTGRPRNGVSIENIKDALFEPEKIGILNVDEIGRKSQKYFGKECEVTVNPDDSILIQTNRKGKK